MLGSLKAKALAKVAEFVQKHQKAINIFKPIETEQIYITVDVDRLNGTPVIMIPYRIAGMQNVLNHLVGIVVARTNCDTDEMRGALYRRISTCALGPVVFKFKDGNKKLRLTANINGYFIM